MRREVLEHTATLLLLCSLAPQEAQVDKPGISRIRTNANAALWIC